jgi:hypothetical protein
MEWRSGVGASRIPGALDSIGGAGLVLIANLAGKGARKAAAKLAARELGPRIMKVVFGKRTVRFVGKQWERAFAHITEHFSARGALAAGRSTAGIFLPQFRAKEVIQRLITDAVKSPSAKTVSRSFVHGVTAGEPVIIVEREFGHVIGEAFKMVQGQVVKDVEKEMVNGVERILWNGDCRVLRVIYNSAGEILTAFPVRAVRHGL